MDLLAIVAALILGFASRHDIGSDGLAYLEVGEAYFRGDWSAAVNATWSPMYSWLVGAALWMLRPAPLWEATVVHGVNLLIYVFALVAFRYFLRGLLRWVRVADEWPVRVLGYGLFIWSSLSWITVGTVGPDLGVAAFVYLELALLLRMASGWNSNRAFLVLGAVAGFGYLMKAVMLPVGLSVLAAAAAACWPRHRWRTVLSVTCGLAALAAVAGPFVVALSISKGHVTFGDSWKYMYARNVNRVGMAVHWQGDEPGQGRPLHPTRRLTNSPSIYEFAEPIAGAYPPWHEPSYWYHGASTEFRIRNQLQVILRNIKMYVRMFGAFFVPDAAPLPLVVPVCVGLLAYGSCAVGRTLSRLASLWFVVIPCAAALGLYLLVHVEARYVGAQVTVVWTMSLACAVVEAERRMARGAAVCCLLALTLPVVAPAAGKGFAEARSIVTGEATVRQWPLHIARALRDSGVRAGDRVGFIGTGFVFYWARLAGVRVVAEIRQMEPTTSELAHIDTKLAQHVATRTPPDVEAFWRAGADAKEGVISVFRRLGVVAIVAQNPPATAAREGWIEVPGARHSIYLLD